MFSAIRKRVRKVGYPPGTPIYTGDKSNKETLVTIINYDDEESKEVDGMSFSQSLEALKKMSHRPTWVNIEGLGNVKEIEEIAAFYKLHPLTVEDILNIEQRPKLDEYDHYLFLTLRAFNWNRKETMVTTEQISFVLGKNYILSFQEFNTTRFSAISKRLQAIPKKGLQQQGCDYLLYRFIDEVVDEYFIILDLLSDKMEKVEQNVISNPTPKNARTVYQLKRQLFIIRKAIWPLREVINHIMNDQNNLINPKMNVFFRDLYDHAVQAIDTLETFRDIISTTLDMYFSSITNRMNEIMKTLTVISTIFIPITAVASIYGMNFDYLPGLHTPLGCLFAFGVMTFTTVSMLIYFRRKNWL